MGWHFRLARIQRLIIPGDYAYRRNFCYSVSVQDNYEHMRVPKLGRSLFTFNLAACCFDIGSHVYNYLKLLRASILTLLRDVSITSDCRALAVYLAIEVYYVYLTIAVSFLS